VLFTCGFQPVGRHERLKSVISAIRVEGNVSLKESEILARVRSKTGDVFNPEIATEDKKRIAGLKGAGILAIIHQAVNGKIELTYVIAEKNLIRAIEFTGNKAFSESKLKEKLGLRSAIISTASWQQTYI